MSVKTNQISLDQLSLGQQGVIVRVGGHKRSKRCLLDMGSRSR